MCIMRVYSCIQYIHIYMYMYMWASERIAMRDHVYAIVSGNSRYPAGETRSVGGRGEEATEGGGGNRGSVVAGTGDRRSIAGHTNHCHNTRAHRWHLRYPFHHLSSLGHSFCLHGTMISLTCTRRIARTTIRSTEHLGIIIGIAVRITRLRTEVVHASA